MYAIKAIYDGTNFKPMQPIPVKENYEVVITFIEPVKKDAADVSEPIKKPRSELIGLLKGKIPFEIDDEPETIESVSAETEEEYYAEIRRRAADIDAGLNIVHHNPLVAVND